MPDELKLKTDGTFLSLQTLWNNLVERYTSLKKPISNDLKELFSQTKLMVLNPQAHFQSISSPLYKFELDRAFELVDKIEKECPIPEKTILLGKGMKLIYKHHSENYILYLELMSDFTINLFEIGDKQVLLPKCKILKWSFKDVDFLDVNTSKVMKYNIKKPIIHSLGKVIDTNVNHSLLPNTINLFLENTQIENSIWGLKEIIDKAEISFRYDFIHRKMIASIS